MNASWLSEFYGAKARNPQRALEIFRSKTCICRYLGPISTRKVIPYWYWWWAISDVQYHFAGIIWSHLGMGKNWSANLVPQRHEQLQFRDVFFDRGLLMASNWLTYCKHVHPHVTWLNHLGFTWLYPIVAMLTIVGTPCWVLWFIRGFPKIGVPLFSSNIKLL